jgi:hypothetical protein
VEECDEIKGVCVVAGIDRYRGCVDNKKYEVPAG